MKFKKALLAAGLGLLLAGCSTGQTTIPDGSEVLMTVGDQNFTREKEYALIKDYSGPQTLISLVNKQIYDKEIGRPDDMMKKQQEILEDYKQTPGFEDQIKSLGFADSEDYLNRALVPNAQAQELAKKYFTDAKEEIISEFDPVLAVIIETDSEDNANKALDALKNGEDAGKVGAQYGLESSSYTGQEQIVSTADTTLPDELRNAIQDAGKDGVLDQVFTNDTSTDNKQYYVASVVSRDYDKNLSKIISALSSNQTISNDCEVYYLKKYDFEVHDQYIFDYFKAMNPDYLVSRPDLAEKADSETSSN